MSTLKADYVVGSTTPLPIIISANDVETIIANQGQSAFTTTRFDRNSTIRVFANNANGSLTEIAAQWFDTNRFSISGYSPTAGQKIYAYSVGPLASSIIVKTVETNSYISVSDYINSLEIRLITANSTIQSLTNSLNQINNNLVSNIQSQILSF